MIDGAHPPGMIKSLVYSLIRTYYIQNTYITDFNTIIKKIFSRLLARGYCSDTLLPLFKENIVKVTTNPTLQLQKHRQTPTTQQPNTNAPPKKINDNNNNTLFLHLEYHPQDISRNKIRTIYEKPVISQFRNPK